MILLCETYNGGRRGSKTINFGFKKFFTPLLIFYWRFSYFLGPNLQRDIKLYKL
jgi:hypothetical protein